MCCRKGMSREVVGLCVRTERERESATEDVLGCVQQEPRATPGRACRRFFWVGHSWDRGCPTGYQTPPPSATRVHIVYSNALSRQQASAAKEVMPFQRHPGLRRAVLGTTCMNCRKWTPWRTQDGPRARQPTHRTSHNQPTQLISSSRCAPTWSAC